MYGARRAILAFAAMPALLAAQGRGGGMGGMGGMGRGGGMGGRGGMGGARSAPSFPVAKDLEKLNPAALLADKRKKLSLADSRVAELRALELRIFERNGALLAQYDSVRRDYRPPSGQPRTAADDKAQADAIAQMRFMHGILERLIERRRTDVRDCLGLMPDDQKKKAAEFLDRQDREFLEQIPSTRAVPGEEEIGGRRSPPGAG